jgi:hypothetical protein
MEFCSGKAVAGGDVRETHEGMHQGKLAGVIEAQSRNALSRRSDGRFGEPSQLATVNEGLKDILGIAPVDVELGKEALPRLEPLGSGCRIRKGEQRHDDH